MYVYILSSTSKKLYVGVTNDLQRRLFEHKSKIKKGFTATYNINRLVRFEEYSDTYTAIAREKELKNLSRNSKINLIESCNPRWIDLSLRFGDSTAALQPLNDI